VGWLPRGVAHHHTGSLPVTECNPAEGFVALANARTIHVPLRAGLIDLGLRQHAWINSVASWVKSVWRTLQTRYIWIVKSWVILRLGHTDYESGPCWFSLTLAGVILTGLRRSNTSDAEKSRSAVPGILTHNGPYVVCVRL